MTELFIEDLGAAGDGIARQEGRTLFVEGALKGEKVEAKLRGDRASVTAVLEASPDRTAPPCPHAGVCGGCRLQHIKPEAYAAWKQEQLKKLLSSHGIETPLQPLQISKPGTRRRARCAAVRQKGQILVGFNRRQSHEVIPITACPVLAPQLVEILTQLPPYLASWLPKEKDAGDLQITLLEDGIDLLLIGGTLSLDARQDLAEMAERYDIARLSWRKWDRSPTEPLAHRRPIFIRRGGVAVPFPPGSFLQATTDGEAALLSFATTQMSGASRIADLFCGLGGFGLSLSGAKERLFADLDGPAVAALAGAVRQDPRCKVLERDLLRDPLSPDELNPFDAILFDPPRDGAKQQAEALAESHVPLIVAISCDPVSFVRDADILQKGGYRLKVLQPVDQFLYSVHLEVAATFLRS